MGAGCLPRAGVGPYAPGMHTARAAPLAVLVPAVLTLAGGWSAAPAAAAPPAGGPCARLGSPEVTGTVASDELDELSGLGASRTLDGIMWAHNDSGDTARLFALDEQGQDLGTYDVVDPGGQPVAATDWEDLAVVRDPADGSGRIYVADIGDNAAARAEGVTLYRIAEPTARPDGAGGTMTVDATLVVHYPDGPTDAEALLVDPVDGTAVIVTKDVLGTSLVLTVPATAWTGGTTTDVDATIAGRLELGLTELTDAGALGTDLPGTLVTAADVSPDGSLAVVRTYQALVLMERSAGTSLAEALTGPHCLVAGPEEPQGEAVAITADGTAVLTATEVQRAVDDGQLPAGATSPISRLALAPATDATVVTEPATATEPTQPTGTAEADETSGTSGAADSTASTPETAVPVIAPAPSDSAGATSEPATSEPATSEPATAATTGDTGTDDRGAAYVVAAVGALVAVGVIVFALRPRRRPPASGA